MSDATEAASMMHERTTRIGSTMPAWNMSLYSSCCASYPTEASVISTTFSTMTGPSTPALFAIVFIGSRAALRTIMTPVRRSCGMSSSVLMMSSSTVDARSSAVPPPGTMPSERAARAALRASITRSFDSLTSVRVSPPTRITAYTLSSFAMRAWSHSRSSSSLLRSSFFCSRRTRVDASAVPRTAVLSRSWKARVAEPSSTETSGYREMSPVTCAPVAAARS
mmetsp:Transcript_41851/g.129335  ORF Transcript_41851/g.129335 Transcript_41851/m.129335 type:complete len:223 (+) Transcript_41851:200-868(+)